MTTAAWVAWAAWAAWTCKSAVRAAMERARATGPFSFGATVIIRAFPQSPGQVAQLVEQRTENPCVAGSIPALATISFSLVVVDRRQRAVRGAAIVGVSAGEA